MKTSGGGGTCSLFCFPSLWSISESVGPVRKVLVALLIVCPFLREFNVTSVSKDNSIIYIKI